jgi:hypothetical protein
VNGRCKAAKGRPDGSKTDSNVPQGPRISHLASLRVAETVLDDLHALAVVDDGGGGEVAEPVVALTRRDAGRLTPAASDARLGGVSSGRRVLLARTSLSAPAPKRRWCWDRASRTAVDRGMGRGRLRRSVRAEHSAAVEVAHAGTD